MLEDKDRIFRNLYGLGDWRLAGARARGAWRRHQGAHRQGPRLDHQRGEGLGSSGPRRGRIPDRPQVVVHAQERPAAILPRRQRRRERAGLLQGPRDHAARSASADRGRAARRLRHARAHLLRLRARRVHPRARAAAGGGRRGLRGQAHRQGQHERLGLRHPRPPWRRRLHLRRGDGAVGKPRRQEGHAAPEAAVPGQCRPLRRADHRQQRREHRGRRPTSCAGAGRGLPRSGSPTTPAPSCSRSPATSSAPASSRRRWASR